jgi:hypothetical protein
MTRIVDMPLLVFVLSFIALWLSALAGIFFRKQLRPMHEDERDNYGTVQAATLTLLGLLIGFTFSMAISRYEQRKNCEEAEANAIGTEYVRADLLPAANATALREVLKNYLDRRVLFYTTLDPQELRKIDANTGQLQDNLWSIVRVRAATQPTPVVAIVASGMNDVLNSQGYTQAAWWNRIPSEAWILLIAIAIGCNLLIGYSARRISIVLIVLPIAASLSFCLIADIDSPREGMIRVQPQNLMRLSQTLPR